MGITAKNKKNIQKPFSFIFLTASVVAITNSRQFDDDEKMKREKTSAKERIRMYSARYLPNAVYFHARASRMRAKEDCINLIFNFQSLR